MNNLIERFKFNLANIQGWKTNRKIVVIESDDWGSIRNTGIDNIRKLKIAGIEADKCPYLMNDALESEEDLEQLFNVLKKYKDSNGNYPVFTSNVLVANPDLKKIKESDFSNYYNESVIQTFKNSKSSFNSLNLWKQGLENKLFFPQSHGREHLNIARWMQDLQSNNLETRLAFELGIFGLSANVTKIKRGSYLAAYDLGTREKPYDRKNIVKEGLLEFEKLMGYKSRSFIAPNYVWDNEIEEGLYEEGVEFIQSSFKQNVSKYADEKHKSVRHYTGKKNKDGLIYITRNVYFEPFENPKIDSVGLALKQINTSFTWGKPVVISSHRANYIGSINESNRKDNLTLLDKLLSSIIKKWPEVEFMTTVQLGKLISV